MPRGFTTATAGPWRRGYPQEAAGRLADEALARLSTDNLTVVVLDLRPVTAELAREEMEVLSVLDWAAGRHA